MRGHRYHLTVATVLVLITTVPLYFILDAIYELPVQASKQAGQIDTMFDAHFILIAFLFALVMVFMLYSLFVFRRKEGDVGDGEHMHGNTALEIAWTVAPLALVIIFAVWGTQMLSSVTAAQADEYAVKVIGRRWSWSFVYPEEGITSSKLVLPINRPVRLEMISEDVIHSFWVPEFRVKQDLLPNQMKVLRFEPVMLGEYKVRCAEICGGNHAYMESPVSVVSEEQFAEFLVAAKLLPSDPVERGMRWYTEFGCSGCHTLDGTNSTGPSWQGIYGREQMFADGTTVITDEEYLRESILNPNAKIVAGYASGLMPLNFADQFAAKAAEWQAQGITDVNVLEELIAYMKTLTP